MTNHPPIMRLQWNELEPHRSSCSWDALYQRLGARAPPPLALDGRGAPVRRRCAASSLGFGPAAHGVNRQRFARELAAPKPRNSDVSTAASVLCCARARGAAMAQDDVSRKDTYHDSDDDDDDQEGMEEEAEGDEEEDAALVYNQQSRMTLALSCPSPPHG
ncbi:hypothetical protein BJV74DRAFT_795790 [Russula compacta]|nr:hypothetical protein BJV74DRAFT_795790 [Russula compacta]